MVVCWWWKRTYEQDGWCGLSLEKAGYEVLEADNGKTAVSVRTRVRIDSWWMPSFVVTG
jgi:hypothetical protein